MMTRTDRRRFPVLLAVIAALAMAMLFSPVQAQEGSAPDKPRGLEATATHDSVTLTWDNPGDDSITGYVILRRVRVNNTGGDFSVLVSDTGTAALTYTDDTVAASLTYTYRIKAINEHGVSERSRWFHVDTPAAPEPEEEQAAEPPDQPTGLEATATHDSVTLTWDDPGDDSITGYVILRRIPGVDPQGHFNELVSNTGTDATTYTDDTVSAETRYTYRIKAINEHGVSERSRWSHIDVPAAPEAAEGDDPDGEGDGGGAPGGPGKRANVAEPSDGDCAAGASTTCEVDVGGSVTGNIGSAGDYDWFEVDLEAGTRYQFDLEGAPTERGTLDDPFLGLYNPLSLATIAANDKGGVGNNSRMTYTVTATGTYYLDVSQSTDASAGTYTLSVIVLGANGASEADTDFPNNNTTSGKVEVGASVTGNVESATDKDWFEVDLEAGKRYQFDLEGAPNGRGTQPDPYLVLYDGSANDIRDNDDLTPGNFNSAIVYDITATGTYYLEARGATIADTGTYTLSVSDVETEEEPCTLNDGDFWCGVVTVGPILSGTNTIGHGYIEFSGISGGSFEGETEFTVGSNNYTFEGIYVSSTGGTTGALNFKTVALFSDDDKEALELHIDVDGTSSTRAISDAVSGVATGLILWTSAGLDWSLATTVTARLRTPPSDDPVDDCPGDTTTTCEVDVGGSATGNIETVTDRDWFKVDLEAGKFYQIDLEGDAGGGGTLEDPYLRRLPLPVPPALGGDQAPLAGAVRRGGRDRRQDARQVGPRKDSLPAHAANALGPSRRPRRGGPGG